MNLLAGVMVLGDPGLDDAIAKWNDRLDGWLILYSC